MTEEEILVIGNMNDYGGSFVKALAVCFLRADPVNFQKLKNAFSDYWLQYSTQFKTSDSQKGGNKDYA